MKICSVSGVGKKTVELGTSVQIQEEELLGSSGIVGSRLDSCQDAAPQPYEA